MKSSMNLGAFGCVAADRGGRFDLSGQPRTRNTKQTTNAILTDRKQDSVAERNRSIWQGAQILRISKGPMVW